MFWDLGNEMILTQYCRKSIVSNSNFQFLRVNFIWWIVLIILDGVPCGKQYFYIAVYSQDLNVHHWEAMGTYAQTITVPGLSDGQFLSLQIDALSSGSVGVQLRRYASCRLCRNTGRWCI